VAEKYRGWPVIGDIRFVQSASGKVHKVMVRAGVRYSAEACNLDQTKLRFVERDAGTPCKRCMAETT